MSNRIDHATKAKAILANTQPEEMGTTANWLVAAHVHATLALVEQKRIANLIAYGETDGPGKWDELIEEELGL